ncbi:MAG: hypothetical protein HYY17_16740 [Planctomycetes bacterium]|nr:hypothetical protein [Planctomycetota bacterium]
MRRLRWIVLGALAMEACSLKNADDAPSRYSLVFSESPIVFPDTFPTRSKTKVVSLANDGQIAIQVSLLAAPAPPFTAAFSQALPLTLQPGVSIEITLTFAPASTSLFTGQIVLATSAPTMPTLALTLTGWGRPGVASAHVVGGLSDASAPYRMADGRLVFAASGPDLTLGTDDDQLVLYHPGKDEVTALSVPAIAQGPTSQKAATGPYVFVPTGGPNMTVGDADDTLVMIQFEGEVTTIYSATVGALATTSIGRPMEYVGWFAAIATGGPNSTFNDFDDEVVLVKFLPTLSVVHVTVGYLDPASPVCWPASASDGVLAFASPGPSLAFGDGDDRVWFLTFSLDAGTLTAASMAVTGPLDPVLSALRVWHPQFAAQMRPGVDGAMGTPDDVFVMLDTGGAVITPISIPNATGHVEIYGQSVFNFGFGELLVGSAGPDGTAGTPDDVVYYIAVKIWSGVQSVIAVPFAGTVPFLGSSEFSVPTSSSYPSPVGLLEPNTYLIHGTQFLALSVGGDTLPGTFDDAVNFATVPMPITGPITSGSATIGRLSPASVPAILQPALAVFTGLGADGLPLNADDVIHVALFRESPAWVGSFPLAGLASTPVSRPVPVSPYRFMIFAAGADMTMNTADDALVLVTLTPP